MCAANNGNSHGNTSYPSQTWLDFSCEDNHLDQEQALLFWVCSHGEWGTTPAAVTEAFSDVQKTLATKMSHERRLKKLAEFCFEFWSKRRCIPLQLLSHRDGWPFYAKSCCFQFSWHLRAGEKVHVSAPKVLQCENTLKSDFHEAVPNPQTGV